MCLPMEWPIQMWVENDQTAVFQKGTCVNSKLKGACEMRLKWIGELKAENIGGINLSFASISDDANSSC